MILPRTNFPDPPPAKTSHQNNPTLLVSWWCTGFALAIILVRLAGRYVRMEKLFKEDKVMALSMIPLCARMGLVHVILIWGTNNVAVDNLSPQDIRHREIGSRLVLASRIMYAMFLWIAKFTVSEFLKRLTSMVWKRTYEIGLHCIRWFLIFTFVAVLIATLSECRPFDLYWQVSPDPGPHCREGRAQLITMGTTDVITDLLLVCFPIPIVLKSHMQPGRKLSLILLFALSLILVGITIYRVVGVTDRHGDQQFRSLFASLEILAAAAVSNAIVLGSFVRDRGAKKQRFRFGSAGANSSADRNSNVPKRAITARDWGSDADLVGGLGMRCAPELTTPQESVPRPAPVALPSTQNGGSLNPGPIKERDWSQQVRDSSDSDRLTDLEKNPDSTAQLSPGHTELPTTPRGMSFFDVGGLLGDDAPPKPVTRPRQSSLSSPEVPRQRKHSLPFGIPHRPSQSALQRLRANSVAHPPSANANRVEGSSTLQDVGGLLSSDIKEGHHPKNQGEDETNKEIDEKNNLESSGSSISMSEKSSPPSAPEVHRDMSLVDVLRETPPPSVRGPSSRQVALQRMRRRPESENSGDGASGPGFQDVGGLLS